MSQTTAEPVPLCTGAEVHEPEPRLWLNVVTACVLLFFFGFCDKSNLRLWNYLYAGVVSLFLLAELTFRSGFFDSAGQKWLFFTYAAACVGTALTLIYVNGSSTVLMFWLFMLMLAMFAGFLHVRGLLSDERMAALLIAGGIMLRFVYVLYTGTGTRQHDIGTWSGTGGHDAYILYWYRNGLKLPDFDVRIYWQFYHPPLHHWLMALALKLFTAIGLPFETACEALQALPFLYSCLAMPVCFRIFRLTGLEGFPLAVSMSLVCFHPSFVLLAGLINNDMLCTLFMFLSVLLALRWYREPTLRRILPLAFSIGLGMMTKLSAWLVLPAVALLFLCVFDRRREARKRLLLQFVCFGLICAPLGLWWQIRNLLAFGVPLTYIPRLPETYYQYLGGESVTKRLFDFSGRQFAYIYDARTAIGSPYNEYNPAVGLLKTALFDEGVYTAFPSIHRAATVLFRVGTLLGVISFVVFAVMLLRGDSGLDTPSRAFLAVLALTILISYYLFCFAYPFVCTMNCRYCMPLIPLSAMGLGLLLKRCSGVGAGNKLLRCVSGALTALFAFASCLLYSLIG